MSPSQNFSGFGLYFLWFLLFVWFYAGISAIFAFGVQREAGIPIWLLILRIAILMTLFLCTFLTLGRKRLAVFGFWATAVLMIPITITYNYFFNLDTPGFAATGGWIVQNTIVTAVVVMIMVTLYNYSIRSQLNTFR